jgi:PAS domain S-box-containing protein
MDDVARWRRIRRLCAASAGALALLVLVGWLSSLPSLVEVVPGVSAMKANAAVAIILCSAALLLPRARAPLALAAAAIGAVTLLEYLVGELRIDQLLAADHSRAAGRAAPHSAIALAATGLAIAAGRRPRLRAAALSTAAMAVLFGAVGYAYRVHPLTGADGGTGMGPNTLVALVLLLASVVTSRPSAWPLSHLRGRRPTATMSRRLTAAIATVPLAGLLELELQRSGLWTAGVGLALFVVVICGLLKGVVAITARSLDRLEVADRRFQDLLSAAPDAILVATRDGEIVVANDEALRMFGYERQDFVGRNAAELLSGDWSAAGGELFACRRDGLEIPVEVSLGPLDTADGGLVTAVIRDITERRAGDERLRAAAQFFEISHDLLATADSAGYFLELNGAWEQTLGWSPRELRARPFADFVHPEDRTRTQAEHRRFTAGRETDRFQNRYRTKDGGWRWLEWTSVTPPGEGVTYASARDVTERVEAQHALAEARDDALAAARAKSAFLANMSHEIRTPLNGVLGITDLMLDGELTAAQREHAELIRRSGDTLLTVVNDVLDVSKIEAGALQLEEAPFVLLEVVEDALELSADHAARKGLLLTLTRGPGLPGTVRGDAVRLRQVLGNLLSNAVKFTAAGEIRVALSAEGNSVRFVVADEGVGIPPEHVERMFEPFTQADVSTTRRFGGTGLGLAIVSQLVRMMGGEVGVTSTLGAGSSFWFTVPFEQVPVDVARLPRSQQPEAPVAGTRVLVVEDNEINRRVAIELIERRGCSVAVAHNGLEALAALERERFDLVFMDCQMPELDGYEATRRLRTIEGDDRRTPVVAMTAHALAGDRARCLESGMDDYLAKPVRGEDLDRVLARHAPRASALVDDAAAADLRSRVADPAIRIELVDLFSIQAHEVLATLRAGIDAADATSVAAAAHKLKGTCLTLAAAPLGELCSRLDVQARTGALEGAGALVDEIAAACGPTEAALRAALTSD